MPGLDAETADVAVLKVLPAPHAAGAALDTVELALGAVIIKEVALQADVAPKAIAARGAAAAGWLGLSAQAALNLRDGLPVQSMCSGALLHAMQCQQKRSSRFLAAAFLRRVQQLHVSNTAQASCLGSMWLLDLHVQCSNTA